MPDKKRTEGRVTNFGELLKWNDKTYYYYERDGKLWLAEREA